MAGHFGPDARQDDVGPRQYFAGRFANDEMGITQLIKVRGIKVPAQSKSYTQPNVRPSNAGLDVEPQQVVHRLTKAADGWL